MAAAKDHKTFVKAHKAHDKKANACLVYCTSKYEPGELHSHRWHAAERARAETRVPYTKYELFQRQQIWRAPKALGYLTELAGRNVADSVSQVGNKVTANVDPFSVDDKPFKHNAHHIIPSGSLEEAIGRVVAKAAPNEGKMQELIVGGLLEEPYNNNDKPNMIVLPMLFPDSDKLGLPTHLEKGAGKNHPDYSRGVLTNLNLRFGRAYTSLATDVAAQKHVGKTDMPAMRASLVSLSNSVYEAIIALAVANKAKRKSLDALVGAIMSLAQKLRSR